MSSAVGSDPACFTHEGAVADAVSLAVGAMGHLSEAWWARRAGGHVRRARFAPRPSDWMRPIASEELLQRLEDSDLRLVDVRDPAEFSGEQLRAARGGHIPGAVLWPWEENLRPDGTMRDPEEIGARAAAAGLLPEQELVTCCQGGVRAAHAALALRLAGYPHVRVYDGSWADWGNDPALPIEAAFTPV